MGETGWKKYIDPAFIHAVGLLLLVLFVAFSVVMVCVVGHAGYMYYIVEPNITHQHEFVWNGNSNIFPATHAICKGCGKIVGTSEYVDEHK